MINITQYGMIFYAYIVEGHDMTKDEGGDDLAERIVIMAAIIWAAIVAAALSIGSDKQSDMEAKNDN